MDPGSTLNEPMVSEKYFIIVKIPSVNRIHNGLFGMGVSLTDIVVVFALIRCYIKMLRKCAFLVHGRLKCFLITKYLFERSDSPGGVLNDELVLLLEYV